MLRFTLLIFATALLSCKHDKSNASSKIEITPGISTIYAIDMPASKSEWTMNLNGQITQVAVPLCGGKISVLEGIPAAADFELNLADLKILKRQDKEISLLEQQLKDTTVFNTREFPICRAILSKIESVADKPNISHRLTLDLKIANQIRPIQADVNIQIADSLLTMKCIPIAIDLIEWGIKNQEKTTLQFSLYFRKENPLPE